MYFTMRAVSSLVITPICPQPGMPLAVPYHNISVSFLFPLGTILAGVRFGPVAPFLRTPWQPAQRSKYTCLICSNSSGVRISSVSEATSASPAPSTIACVPPATKATTNININAIKYFRISFTSMKLNLMIKTSPFH